MPDEPARFPAHLGHRHFHHNGGFEGRPGVGRDEETYSESILIKLGTEAGGGIGPEKDVVAFNYTCTHQGGPLQGTYQAADKALGPCPLHLTTFDLTRYGIFISGQAYQSLPQVLLELDGDNIYAVGMFGLIYGRFDNLQA